MNQPPWRDCSAEIAATHRKDASKPLRTTLVFVALIAIGLLVYGASAWAHDFYEFRCCSGSLDCRPVPEGAIRETPEGYRIEATGEVVPYSDTRIRQSPDQRFHWCSVAGEEHSRTLCIYSPPRSY